MATKGRLGLMDLQGRRSSVAIRLTALALVVAVIATFSGNAGSQTAGKGFVVRPADPDAVTYLGDAVPANPRPAPTQTQLSQPFSGANLRFISLPPCRILDTRSVVGDLAANEVRHFKAYGSLSGQGGNSAGCGVPSYARAIQANFGAIRSGAASGYIKGWAYGDTEPNASMLNFPPDVAIANMVTIEIARSSYDFTVKASNPVHVFADVVGYWIQPLYAEIAASGTPHIPVGAASAISSGLVSSTRTSTGTYSLVFNRPVLGCSVSATLSGISGGSSIVADADGGGSTVYVEIKDIYGEYADEYFYVSLDC